MEAAILTAAPPSMPMQDAQPASATQSSDEAGSFSTLLAAAIHSGDETERAIAPQPTFPEEEETSAAAELAAITFQQLPTMELKQQVSEPVTTVQPLTPPATEISPDQDIASFFSSLEDDGTAPLAATPSLSSENESALSSSTGENSLPELKNPTSSTNDHSILNRQIQAILDNNPKINATLHPSTQNNPAEALTTLTSTILPTEGQNESVITAVTQETLLQSVVDGKNTTEKMEGGRHSLNEQYISAKLESASEQKDPNNRQQESGQQGAQQENNTTQINTSTTTATFNSTEQGSHFLLNTPSLTTGTQTGASTSTPVSTAPGQFVPAEEIINHLVERFSMNPRLQTSKISLSLTPAELGSVKIDIMVQGDSIKAHIVAGSQQIQDTIEKQMPRLRSVLEQQGFTVDDFQVSLESATSDSNDFFEQQFTSNQSRQEQQGANPAARLQEMPFNLSLSAAETSLSSSASGINLNI